MAFKIFLSMLITFTLVFQGFSKEFKFSKEDGIRIDKSMRIPKEVALKGHTREYFEWKNKDSDVFRGFITNSKPYYGDQYVAYLMIRWGDLDNVVKAGKRPKNMYFNWDGHVKLPNEKVHVFRELAFDDGSKENGSRLSDFGGKWKEKIKKRADVLRSKGKHREAAQLEKRMRERGKLKLPKEGSGRDRLINDKMPDQVTWHSGVVGGKDGLIVRFLMKDSEGVGIVKAGKHTMKIKVTANATSFDVEEEEKEKK